MPGVHNTKCSVKKLIDSFESMTVGGFGTNRFVFAVPR